MTRAVFVMLLFAWPVTLSVHAQGPPENRVLSRRMERELTEHLRWEILWNHRGIRIPPNGIARLAVYDSARSLSISSLFICSRDLGMCAEYRMWDRRLDDRIHSVECSADSLACKDGQDELDSLLDYVHQRNPALPIPQRSQSPPPVLTMEDLRGFLGGAILGTMTVNLGSRADIVEHFRQMRPPELNSLEKYLSDLRNGGYSSIIIPCFSIEATRVVELYGDRPGRGPIIFALQWSINDEGWFGGGQYEPPGGPTAADIRRIEAVKPLFESIACATVKFD